MAVIAGQISAQSAQAAKPCISTVAKSAGAFISIHGGSREDTFSVQPRNRAKLLQYLSADLSEWRQPTAAWSTSAVVFEIAETPHATFKCVAALDGSNLYSLTLGGEGYLVRALLGFESARIYKLLEAPMVKVY